MENAGTQTDDELMELWLSDYEALMASRERQQREAWSALVEQQQALALEHIKIQETLADGRLGDRRRFQSWTRIVDGSGEEPISHVGALIPRILSTVTLGSISNNDLSPRDEPLLVDDPLLISPTKEIYRLQLPPPRFRQGVATPKWCILSCDGEEVEDNLIIGREGEALVYRLSLAIDNDDALAHVCGTVALRFPFNNALYFDQAEMRIVCGIRKRAGTGISVIDLVAECEVSNYGQTAASSSDVVCCGQTDDGYFSFHEDSTFAIWNATRMDALLTKQHIGYKNSRRVKSAVFLADHHMLMVVYDGIAHTVVSWTVTRRKCKFHSCLRLGHEFKNISVAQRMVAESPVTLSLTTADGVYVVLTPFQVFQKHLDLKDVEALCLDGIADAAKLLFNSNDIGICASTNPETGLSIWTLEGGELLSRVPHSVLQGIVERSESSKVSPNMKRRSQSNLQTLLGSSIKTTGASIIPMLNNPEKSRQHSAASADTLGPTVNELQWFSVRGRWFLAVSCGNDILTIFDPFESNLYL